MTDATEEIIQQIAEEQGLPAEQVRKVVSSQFKFVVNTMKKGTFETVRLQYLGKFTVDKKRLEEMNKDK